LPNIVITLSSPLNPSERAQSLVDTFQLCTCALLAFGLSDAKEGYYFMVALLAVPNNKDLNKNRTF